MVTVHVKAGALASIGADDLADRHEPAVEAFRLGVALGRLKAYDALAGSVLGPAGEPLVKWWPVAAAFSRLDDKRALGPLVAFARGESLVGRSPSRRADSGRSRTPARSTCSRRWPGTRRDDLRTAMSAVELARRDRRSPRRPGAARAVEHERARPHLHVEVFGTLAAARVAPAQDLLQDLVTHRSAAVRAAAFRSLRALDPQGFVMVLSGLNRPRTGR